MLYFISINFFNTKIGFTLGAIAKKDLECDSVRIRNNVKQYISSYQALNSSENIMLLLVI